MTSDQASQLIALTGDLYQLQFCLAFAVLFALGWIGGNQR